MRRRGVELAHGTVIRDQLRGVYGIEGSAAATATAAAAVAGPPSGRVAAVGGPPSGRVAAVGGPPSGRVAAVGGGRARGRAQERA
ncbi:MAG: hypothetical protein ACYCZP_11750, partial [Acidimicrobiales bacterium]